MPILRRIFAALFIVAGALHFIKPQTYEAMMPPWIPMHAESVAVSGVAEIVGGITGAMVAAVPSVPYSRATMEPERTFAADVFKHTLVLPHDAATPSPAADIALRYAVAEMIMITLAYRPNVEYDADLAAKVAAIPPDVSAPAAAMHGAVKAFMETRQGHAAQ